MTSLERGFPFHSSTPALALTASVYTSSGIPAYPPSGSNPGGGGGKREEGEGGGREGEEGSGREVLEGGDGEWELGGRTRVPPTSSVDDDAGSVTLGREMTADGVVADVTSGDADDAGLGVCVCAGLGGLLTRL